MKTFYLSLVLATAAAVSWASDVPDKSELRTADLQAGSVQDDAYPAKDLVGRDKTRVLIPSARRALESLSQRTRERARRELQISDAEIDRSMSLVSGIYFDGSEDAGGDLTASQRALLETYRQTAVDMGLDKVYVDVTVMLDPPDSTLLMNGEQTPLAENGIYGVFPGALRIEARSEGHRPCVRRLVVEANSPEFIFCVLERQ